MIWSWIVDIILQIVTYLVGKLPTVSDTSGIGEAVSVAGTYIAIPYSFIPTIVITLLAILSFSLVFEGGYKLYQVINWVRKLFPTQS